jgi:hypothetical protein
MYALPHARSRAVLAGAALACCVCVALPSTVARAAVGSSAPASARSAAGGAGSQPEAGGSLEAAASKPARPGARWR